MAFVATALLLGSLGSAAPVIVSAQASCGGAAEPDDTPEDAPSLRGGICVEGELGEGDQDLAIWEVTPDAAALAWTFELEGVPGTLTGLKVFTVTSGAGVEPVMVDQAPILEIDVPPDTLQMASLPEMALPVGRYLLGVSRSGLPGGGEPADTTYRYRVLAVEPPPGIDIEPNDDIEVASPVRGAFVGSGDVLDSQDLLAWHLDAAGRWDIEVRMPLGQMASLRLLDADGQLIDGASDPTSARLYDLDLGPGDYRIEVGPHAGESRPYRIAATPTATDWDPEPNDESAGAVAIEDGLASAGRLARQGDRDRFVLRVPPVDAVLRTARLLWRSETERTLCLLDGDDRDLLCRRGVTGVALPDLALSAGPHVFEVRGPVETTDRYVLRVDPTSTVAGDFEAEPNDDAELATPLDPELGMRGRGGEQDDDVFELRTEGEPQLWEISAIGSDIRRLALTGPSGRSHAQAHVEPGGASAVLTDLYLVPGSHWFLLDAGEGEYAIKATPLGPPSADAEREPNSEPLRSERYRIGTRRTGRLPVDSDRDFYRFTLAAPQHIALHLAPPADGSVGLRLSSGDELIADLRQLPPGEPIAYDLHLQPGDYLLELVPDQPGLGTYELTSERLDPFVLTADQEPNDGEAWARDVPPGLSWPGTSSDSSDVDHYRIPALTSPTPLRIRLEGEGARARLYAGEEPLSLTETEDGSLLAEAAPLQRSLTLEIAAPGDYSVQLSGGGLEPRPGPDPLPVAMSWSFDASEVAAYWPQAQRLQGSVTLSNSGDVPVAVALDLRTSHYLWVAAPAQETIALAPGESSAIAVEVVVHADAWAAEPVLLAARAMDEGHRWVSSTTTFGASAEAPPQASHRAWSLPPELLGGINAASLGLGAVPVDNPDPERAATLFDGVTPDGGGFLQLAEQLPFELIVDLAGDEPVPVAGTILNPQSRNGLLRETPREFELLLSMDGTTWQPALAGLLSPLPIDQAFAMAAPVLARQAMLRIHSLHVEGTPYVSLGEWKVVLEPGAMPVAEPLDLGRVSAGGHVVYLQPQSSSDSLALSIGDEDPARQTAPLDDDSAFELVMGLHEGRAARIDRLEWVDPAGSLPTERLERVEVSTTSVGPTGPWTAAGSWPLTRAADGRVAPFPLEDAGWVRYVKIEGRAPEEARRVELPAALGVIEQAPGPGYRSILGEWGYTAPVGPNEWLTDQTGESAPPAAGPDAGDSPDLATPLQPGARWADRVEIGVDEDWLAIDVPAGSDTLELVVGGGPSVRVSLELYTDDGIRLPMAFRPEPDGSVVYQAAVEPLRGYRLRVLQPPFSAVFAFDTSGSMAHFLDTVVEGIRAFASDVEAGRESVMILPFEQGPLLRDWEDDAYLLQDAVNHYPFDGSSSGAEAGLIAASELLAEREGARAILVVTDAETSTYGETDALWDAFRRIRPIVYSVHVGGAGAPVQARHLMQDWAASGGGHYSYPSNLGEMDRSFDRLATRLRRPADYDIGYSTLSLGPGSLAVRTPPQDADAARGLAPGVGVAIILDTSASMRARIEGRSRIQIARESLEQLVGGSLAEGIPVALRTFGGRGGGERARCQTRLSVPLQPLEPASMLDEIRGLEARRQVRTPIAAALTAVADDLAGTTGPRYVVLVTDGDETCHGDPAAAIEGLKAAGIDVTVNIVGFALDEETLKAEMAGWAELGDGSYFDAAGADDLAASVAQALRAPFRVYGPDGEVYEGGSVDGEPILIDPGTYRVEVLTDPPVEFDEVVVGGGESIVLDLEPLE